MNISHDRFGNINLNEFEKLCAKNTASLVSLVFVNNETGVITQVKEIIALSHRYNCLVHLDSVQALGKIPFSLDEIGPDFASFSGHKIGAMTGIGLLYIAKPEKFDPLLHGGGQERNIRAGTYNASGIHSFRMCR